MSVRRIGAAVLLLSLCAAGAPRAAGTAATPPDGKTLYTAKCQICHSPDGAPKPALKVTVSFKDPGWQKANTDDQIIAAVRDGKPGTTMAAFKDRLTPEQIAAIVAHIRTLAPRE